MMYSEEAMEEMRSQRNEALDLLRSSTFADSCTPFIYMVGDEARCRCSQRPECPECRRQELLRQYDQETR